MADIKDVEQAIDLIKDALVADLPAALDVIDAEKADEITLEDVSTIYVADVAETPVFPCIMITREMTVYPTPTEKSGQEDDNLLIGVFIANSEALNGETIEETLARKLGRTLRGIEAVLSDNIQLKVSGVPQVHWCRATEADFSPTGQLEGSDLYVKAAALRVAVRRYTEA